MSHTITYPNEHADGRSRGRSITTVGAETGWRPHSATESPNETVRAACWERTCDIYSRYLPSQPSPFLQPCYELTYLPMPPFLLVILLHALLVTRYYRAHKFAGSAVLIDISHGHTELRASATLFRDYSIAHSCNTNWAGCTASHGLKSVLKRLLVPPNTNFAWVLQHSNKNKTHQTPWLLVPKRNIPCVRRSLC
jgi:hypothetical protein